LAAFGTVSHENTTELPETICALFVGSVKTGKSVGRKVRLCTTFDDGDEYIPEKYSTFLPSS
jgi:hypothetical protein